MPALTAVHEPRGPSGWGAGGGGGEGGGGRRGRGACWVELPLEEAVVRPAWQLQCKDAVQNRMLLLVHSHSSCDVRSFQLCY